MKKYVLYPGCVPTISDYPVLKSFRETAKKLNFRYIEDARFTCCGGAHLQDLSVEKSIVINARNLALAESLGDVLVTICNTCTLSLLETKIKLDKNNELRVEVNQQLKDLNLPEYQGCIKVQHFIYILEDYFSKISDMPELNTAYQKVYPYYGCHLIRPACFNAQENSSKIIPNVFENILSFFKVETVSGKMNKDCCGFHRILTKKKLADSLSSSIIQDAVVHGAECIVTTCPLCKFSLENSSCKPKAFKILHLEQFLNKSLV